MTTLPPDIQELLGKLGVDPGKWGETPDHLTNLGTVQRQMESLLKLRGVLEQVQGMDQRRLADLKEQLIRMKHGGGS